MFLSMLAVLEARALEAKDLEVHMVVTRKIIIQNMYLNAET